MKFTIRFNAERRDGKGGAESHFNYLWQDPVVREIIVIIKNSFISRGVGGATARTVLFGMVSRQSVPITRPSFQPPRSNRVPR